MSAPILRVMGGEFGKTGGGEGDCGVKTGLTLFYPNDFLSSGLGGAGGNRINHSAPPSF